ncbi:hypothetical protein GCM10023321_75250 [Pseudonocardia eucalypti]|uniref:Uncharacterized protein n=1 Tax=Pseudonocardia eucalypti TaxID=648755 RepID=A0ABP9RAG7_9PSEU
MPPVALSFGAGSAPVGAVLGLGAAGRVWLAERSRVWRLPGFGFRRVAAQSPEYMIERPLSYPSAKNDRNAQ